MLDQEQAAAGRRRLPRAERERQLLAAAERLIGERGVAAVTMDAVADEVGVSKAMIYAYFGPRQQLLAQVVQKAGDELLQSVTEATNAAGSFEEHLRRGLEASFEFFDRHAAWRVLQHGAGVDAGATAEVEAIRRQQAQYNAAIIRSYAHPSQIAVPATAEAFGEVIVGAVERVAAWREQRPEMSAGEAAALVTRLLLPGLQAMTQPDDSNKEDQS